MLTNSFAKLLSTLCLVALAAGIDKKSFPILATKGIYPAHHVTVSTRVPTNVKLHSGPEYYLGSGQRYGYLDTKHLCGKEPLKGIEVRVLERADFARVTFYKRHVLVTRQGLLTAPALVDLRLSCDHYKFSHSRNRLRLPSLLTSESSESLDLDSEEAVEEEEEEEVQAP